MARYEKDVPFWKLYSAIGSVSIDAKYHQTCRVRNPLCGASNFPFYFPEKGKSDRHSANERKIVPFRSPTKERGGRANRLYFAPRRN